MSGWVCALLIVLLQPQQKPHFETPDTRGARAGKSEQHAYDAERPVDADIEWSYQGFLSSASEWGKGDLYDISSTAKHDFSTKSRSRAITIHSFAF
jgi:hypothetical protein